MDKLINALKMRSATMDTLTGTPRWGLVQSYDPQNYLAKVLIQPEGVLSGWLPIVTPMVGPNWGMMMPLAQGQQVIVIPDGGDSEQGVILGGTWDTQTPVPQIPAAPGGSNSTLQSGEVALVSGQGSFIRLCADGTMLIVGPTIYALGSAGDTPKRLATEDFVFSLYNSHTHSGVSTGTGTSGVPVQQGTTAHVTGHLKAS